jgi:hypothetical protein
MLLAVSRILFASGNIAMVQLFVHRVTSALLGEGVKIDVSYFYTCMYHIPLCINN